MTCSKCRSVELKNVEYAGLKYCKRHFIELITKRIRKDLRAREEITLDKTYYLLKENTPEFILTKYFLERIFGKYLKLTEVNTIKTKNMIIATNLDMETKQFLESYFTNTKYVEKHIRPLRTVTKEEIEKLCEILNIKGKPKKGLEFLEKIDNKYPGSKFSVLRSINHLKK
ncbi:hypothetical protein COV13_04260 [Candidatus Woesearchaeota archaeon CG10_big_fil_rev_8_21_14_0_10_32_9]|nr:MAG: hypothetical protein COV13_04260 [Candidatus Woesearchaeota archaeon CG10_big_fil_rev_8_21_14_0_10_32_9]